MSWQASQWAANIPHGLVGYVAFRALTLLANDAKEDGRATWLEASTVAARLDVSKRTAERAFEELRKAGLIVYGEQRHVAHLPADKRPPVYDLTMAGRDVLLLRVEPEQRGGARQTEPSKMTARAAQNSGPSNLTGPTAGVAVNKEEPPLTTIKTYPGQPQSAAAQPVDNRPRGRHAHVEQPAVVGCPKWRGSMPHTFVRGRCVDCQATPDGGSPTLEADADAAVLAGLL